MKHRIEVRVKKQRKSAGRTGDEAACKTGPLAFW